jgi:hypothetical protein
LSAGGLQLSIAHWFLGSKADGVAKTLNLIANVIPALDNNTQGQAAAGIQ